MAAQKSTFSSARPCRLEAVDQAWTVSSIQFSIHHWPWPGRRRAGPGPGSGGAGPRPWTACCWSGPASPVLEVDRFGRRGETSPGCDRRRRRPPSEGREVRPIGVRQPVEDEVLVGAASARGPCPRGRRLLPQLRATSGRGRRCRTRRSNQLIVARQVEELADPVGVEQLRGVGHRATYPPSMGSRTPVMLAARSEHRIDRGLGAVLGGDGPTQGVHGPDVCAATWSMPRAEVHAAPAAMKSV